MNFIDILVKGSKTNKFTTNVVQLFNRQFTFLGQPSKYLVILVFWDEISNSTIVKMLKIMKELTRK